MNPRYGRLVLIRIDTLHGSPPPAYATVRFGAFGDVVACDLHGSRDVSVAVSGHLPHARPRFEIAFPDRPASIDWVTIAEWPSGPSGTGSVFDSALSKLWRLPASSRWLRVSLVGHPQAESRPAITDIRNPNFETLKLAIRTADRPIRVIGTDGSPDPEPVQLPVIRLSHSTPSTLPRSATIDLRTAFTGVDSLSFYSIAEGSHATFAVEQTDPVTAVVRQREITRGEPETFTILAIDAVGRSVANVVQVYIARGGTSFS